MEILRDDSSIRSVSINERTFVRNCATAISTLTEEDGIDDGLSVLRLDGRNPGEMRSTRLTFGRTTTGRSECTVQLGSSTRVTCILTCELTPPNQPDMRPNDGMIRFNVDISPMACMGSDHGGGEKLVSNRIARVVERTLKDGGAIDVESLCVVGGEWVWNLNVNITALDHGGNLVDASALAAIAALRHFRKPGVVIPDATDGGKPPPPVVLNSDDKEPTPLPLHHTPVCVSFGLFGDPSGATSTVAALLDPSDREELVMDGCVTYAFNKHGELCALDFPGGCELRQSQLLNCAKLAEAKAVELCLMLEDALAAADEKASKERMERLKAMNPTGIAPDASANVPFVEKSNAEDMKVEYAGVDEVGAVMAAAAAEEEKYRLKALDYSLGHVAAKVKENKKDGSAAGSKDRTRNKAKDDFAGSLIDAMLKSAQSNIQQMDVNGTNSNEKSISTTRTKDADDEFASFVAADSNNKHNEAIASNPTSTNEQTMGNIDSDDDEEEVTTLQSEFAVSDGLPAKTITKQTEEKKKQKKDTKKTSAPEEKDDDVDDLAMAVKKKRKGGKKKSAKKR